MESTKLYLLNSLTMLITFTNVENTLKLLLLLLSIIYTGVKIYESLKPKKDETGQ
jgi:hypothetical protein